MNKILNSNKAHTSSHTVISFKPLQFFKNSENLKMEKVQNSNVTCSAASPEVGLN